jgi:hypothetical protein
MKRFVLILAVLFIGYSASAQTPEGIQPGMKYKDLKEYYSCKDYTKMPDQYRSPVGVGVASYLIPGLGEMISGEGWRGVAFMGGWLACHYVTLVGIFELSDAIYWSSIVGAQALRIISCVDATRVAKVKNMYKRDLKGYSLDVDMYPSMNYIKTAEGIQPTAGLTLALRF